MEIYSFISIRLVFQQIIMPVETYTIKFVSQEKLFGTEVSAKN